MKDAADIIKALPHRYPFLMVDRVLELVPGRHAVALKQITKDGPELFLIEAMAQVGAVAASALPTEAAGGADAAGELTPGYLAGLHDVRFNRRPVAGDSVVLTLDFEARMGGLVRFRGTAKIGEEVAAESGLTFSVPGGRL